MLVRSTIEPLLTIYTLLTIIRILITFTQSERSPHWSVRAVCRVTDPAFNLARKVVPPIGGTLDVSGFLVLLVLYILMMVVGR